MYERSLSRLHGLLALSALGALSACSSPGDRSAAATPAEPLVPAHAEAPSWARPSNFKQRVDLGSNISFQVHLPLRNVEAAKAELTAISDPDNAAYGKVLSDADFDAKYGPTEADVAAVRAHFEASGLRVTSVPVNRAYVAVEGTAGQVEAAFSTQLGEYVVGGETRRAPMSAPKLPASVSPHVATVLGLTTHKMLPQYVRASDVRRKGAARAASSPSDVTASTCSKYFGQVKDTTDPPLDGFPSPLPYVNCGYRPAQIREAYGLTTMVRKGTDGTGQKVAIVDAFTPPTLVQDAQTYFANEDADYPLLTSQITLVQGPGTAQPPDTGWYGESSLDVEAVHAVAPGARIVYVGSASAYDVDLIAAVNFILTEHLASVISNSYGSVEAYYVGYTAWESAAIQAGLKGVGLYFATGDGGDNSFYAGFPSPNFPASLTEVTAVGGTSLALGADGTKLFELGWEDGYDYLQPPDSDGGASTWQPGGAGFFAYGGGGAWSDVYLQPSYQKGIVPDAVATDPTTGSIARALPDVSALGDPTTGYLIGETDPNTGEYVESAIGGTSLSTPLFTATVALAQQNAKRTFGFANALFYKASKKGAFTDIAPAASPEAVVLPPDAAAGYAPFILTFDYRGTENAITTAVGFDTVTGLGVPNAAKFFSNVK